MSTSRRREPVAAAAVRLLAAAVGFAVRFTLVHAGATVTVPEADFTVVVGCGLALSLGVAVTVRSTRQEALCARVAADLAAIAAGAYALGVGPLVTGFAAIAMVLVLGRATAGRAVRPVIAATAVALVAGQVAVGTGLAPSAISARDSDLIAAAIAWSVAMVGESFRSAERRVEGMRGTLDRSEAHHRTLIEHGSEIVLVIDGEGRTSYVAPSYERVFGVTPAQRLRERTVDTLHEEDRERWDRALARLAGERRGTAPIEARVADRDGVWHWLAGTLTDHLDDPAVTGYVLNAHDVTEEKAARDALDRAVLYDPDTGLANRRLAIDLLGRRLQRQGRSLGQLLVLFIEIDAFELQVRAHGPAAGAELVLVAARRLARLTEPEDVLARVGRHQFVLVTESVHDEAVSAAVADRAARVLQEPVILDGPGIIGGPEIYVTSSIGIARVDRAATDPEQVLSDAEVAMITARNEGGDRVVFFGPADGRRATDRVKLSGALRRALEDGELSVHFQPIMNLATGDAQGTEALVRWDHPLEGTIMPDEFIPIAEASGIIIPLGSFVLEQACRAVATAWPEGARGLSVAVNISGRQLEDPELDAVVERVLLDSGLDPGQLTLEVTESALPRDVNAAIERLGPLRRLGVRIAIDDFGTGYSSLGYLKALRPDVIKIDRSFISGFLTDRGDSAIVAAVVNLGKAVGIDVLAEGVESAEQAEALRDLGCDLAQGYLFGPPGPARGLLALEAPAGLGATPGELDVG